MDKILIYSAIIILFLTNCKKQDVETNKNINENKDCRVTSILVANNSSLTASYNIIFNYDSTGKLLSTTTKQLDHTGNNGVINHWTVPVVETNNTPDILAEYGNHNFIINKKNSNGHPEELIVARVYGGDTAQYIAEYNSLGKLNKVLIKYKEQNVWPINRNYTKVINDIVYDGENLQSYKIYHYPEVGDSLLYVYSYTFNKKLQDKSLMPLSKYNPFLEPGVEFGIEYFSKNLIDGYDIIKKLLANDSILSTNNISYQYEFDSYGYIKYKRVNMAATIGYSYNCE